MAFDWWLWRKSWFVGSEEAFLLFCSGYEKVKGLDGFQWTVVNMFLFFGGGGGGGG